MQLVSMAGVEIKFLILPNLKILHGIFDKMLCNCLLFDPWNRRMVSHWSSSNFCFSETLLNFMFSLFF